jgi:NhaP-type Na+/H+ or K+/H+ antiporter
VSELYYPILVGLGGVALLVVWLPLLLKKLPLTLPMICVALGYAVFSLASFHPEGLPGLHIAERVTEIVVVIALMGAGLKIDRPFSLRGWQTTWRLLGIGMPLVIVAMMLAFRFIGQMPWPTALLLAAALSPTDPVLAGKVGVGPPGSGQRGEIRFGLTSEAGFNDGFAFPVVKLAILLTTASFGETAPRWAAIDLIGAVAGGAVFGAIIGRFFAWLAFRPGPQLSEAGGGLVALGLAMLCFGAAESLGLNGFIGVFVMALAFRATKREDPFHRTLASFADQIEHLVTMVVLVFFGGAVATGLLTPFRIQDLLLALLLLLVVRPATAWISLLGSPHPAISRALTAFFGLRGIGALYYILHAFNSAEFGGSAERVWPIVGWAVLGSIFLHGVSAAPLMTLADRMRARMREGDGSFNAAQPAAESLSRRLQSR